MKINSIFVLIVFILTACTNHVPATPSQYAFREIGTPIPAVIDLITPDTALSVELLALWGTKADTLGNNIVFSDDATFLQVGLQINDSIARGILEDRPQHANEFSAILLSVIDGSLVKIIQGKFFTGFTNYGPRLTFSPDGRFEALINYSIYLGESFGNLQIHDTSRRAVGLYTYFDKAVATTFSPDGKFLAIAISNGDIWFVPTASWESFLLGMEEDHTYYSYPLDHPLTINVGNSPRGIYFSPDGSVMAISFEDSPTQLWRVADLSFSQLIGIANPTCLTFSYDGDILAAGTMKGSINLWDTETGELLTILDQGVNPVRALAFSPNNRLLASVVKNMGIYIWGILPSSENNISNSPTTSLNQHNPTPTRTLISLPLPTSTPTSAIPSYDTNMPLAWPVPAPTDEQILEAKGCSIETFAKSRYPEDMKYEQLETAYLPHTACDWAVLAAAYQMHIDTNSTPEEGKRAFAQAILINPAFAFTWPLFYNYINTLNIAETPSFSSQPITVFILNYSWTGMGDPANIIYHIEVRNADRNSNEMNFIIQIQPEGFVSQIPTSIDSSLIQAISQALTDFLPVQSSFSLQPCSDNTPHWSSQITFQDGSTLNLNTYSSNLYEVGAPWQTNINGQNYVQFSAALPQAFMDILDALGLPTGQPWASACDWVDVFPFAYP
jgi:hypothetical protein